MQKSKNKPNPQWKKQRRWSLFWLALCSAMVLITVIPFETAIWPQILRGEPDEWCYDLINHNGTSPECSTELTKPLSEFTRIPFFGTLVGIAMMMFPLFYLIPATVLSGISAIGIFRDWRRMPYWELAVSSGILLLVFVLVAYLYLSPQSDVYFVWLWD